MGTTGDYCRHIKALLTPYLRAGAVQGIFLCTLGVLYPLGVGSICHGIWPLIGVFGSPKPRVTNIQGTNLKSLSCKGDRPKE